ncbi:MAG TPA: hypothetical protein VG738_14100 [Chitinophagaceae bacterium]|nr:hypothetical protein [Chitinophagaceae bacterium]
MKKYLFLFALACGTYAVNAQSNDDVPYLTKPLSGEAVQSVEVQTSGGSIMVKGGSGTDARLEMYVKGNNDRTLSKEEIKQRLDEYYDITISVVNHKVTAIAKNKRNISDWRRGVSISFRVYVPQNVSTDLGTSGGSISLSNLSGNEKFQTSGGSLHVDHLSGKVVGGTSGGSIHLSDSQDDIDLSTSGGSIEASNCSGTIRLETSGGSLHLYNLKGSIRAGTSGGSAEGSDISGELAVHTSGSSIRLQNLSCSLDASTSGASINVEMASLGKYLKISNGGGNINLTIPQGKGVDLTLDADKINVNQLDNFRGSQEDGHMKGTLNGGGIPVTLDAGGGKIYLTMK